MTAPRVLNDRGRRVPQPRAGHRVGRRIPPSFARRNLLPGSLAVAGLALIVSLPVVLDAAGVAMFWAGLVLLAAAGCVAVDRSGL